MPSPASFSLAVTPVNADESLNAVTASSKPPVAAVTVKVNVLAVVLFDVTSKKQHQEW